MRNFKLGPAAFLSSFRLRPIVAWKIYFTAVNATRRANRILLRGVNQKQSFFAQKLPDLAPVLNKLIQLKRVTNGTVTKHLVTVNKGLGADPPCATQFLQFCSKKSHFNAILIIFRIFEATWKSKLLKFRSYLKELNCLALEPLLISGQV